MQSVLLRAERANRIDFDDADAAQDSLRDVRIVMEPCGERFFSGNEVRLLRYYDVTPYDAAYVSLAASRNIPFATLDSAFAHAARGLSIPFLLELTRSTPNGPHANVSVPGERPRVDASRRAAGAPPPDRSAVTGWSNRPAAGALRGKSNVHPMASLRGRRGS